MSQNLDYYNKFAKEFFDRSSSVDMTDIHENFLQYIPEEGQILDVGAGSGRDVLVFKKKGYKVTGLEPSHELARLAKAYSDGLIVEETLESFESPNPFDGIWACASLLHFPKLQLPEAFKKIESLLKNGGVFYCSFKEGTFEGERDGRHFTDLEVDELERLVLKATSLTSLKSWQSTEIREESQVSWSNALFKKTQ